MWPVSCAFQWWEVSSGGSRSLKEPPHALTSGSGHGCSTTPAINFSLAQTCSQLLMVTSLLGESQSVQEKDQGLDLTPKRTWPEYSMKEAEADGDKNF